jgi:hypothetical protein|tara:strand:+ start:424 stop:837 length:414 start_codon:yes stop_codon:yes gene_type:complete
MRDKKRKEKAMLEEAYGRVNEMLGPHNNPYPQEMSIAVPVPAEDESCGEYDQSEIDMAGRELLKAQEYAAKLSQMVPALPGLDGWVASKITKAADYLSSVFHYLDYEMNETEVVVDVEEIQAPVEVFNVGYEEAENT